MLNKKLEWDNYKWIYVNTYNKDLVDAIIERYTTDHVKVYKDLIPDEDTINIITKDIDNGTDTFIISMGTVSENHLKTQFITNKLLTFFRGRSVRLLQIYTVDDHGSVWSYLSDKMYTIRDGKVTIVRNKHGMSGEVFDLYEK